MADSQDGRRERQRQRAHFDFTRLEAYGFRPIGEATYPHALCFLRLGTGVYTIGFGTPDQVWLCQHDMVPVMPTHFMDYPD